MQKSVANGIDVIRIFDALNDIRNLQTSIDAAKKEKGAHVQVAISYTTSPVHDIAYFIGYAKQLEEAGYDRITQAYSLRDAVDKARALAVSGGNVLLSPACASFDMFRDYEHRGAVFKEIVNALN